MFAEINSSSEISSPKQQIEKVEVHSVYIEPPIISVIKKQKTNKNVINKKKNVSNIKKSSSDSSSSNTISNLDNGKKLIDDFPKKSDQKSLQSIRSVESSLSEKNDLTKISESEIKEKTEIISPSSSEEIRKTKRIKKKNDHKKESVRDQKDVEEESKKGYSYEEIIGIYLHEYSDFGMDKLMENSRVRISCCDKSKQQFVLKSDPNRNVVSIHEPENVNFIQPIISKEGTMKSVSSSYVWEELIVLNEDISHIKTGKEIFFFEIINIITKNTKQQNNIINDWEYKCWAFMKTFCDKKFLNINKRCQLQLYKYRTIKKNKRDNNDDDDNDNRINIFKQYLMKKRKKYPGYIEVTIKGIQHSMYEVKNIKRSENALQEEKVFDILLSENDSNLNKQNMSKRYTEEFLLPNIKMEWKKLPGQAFKCPNKLIKKLKIPKCFIAKFNKTGDLIAYTTSSNNDENYNIIIATVPELENVICLQGHTNIIYDLDWNDNLYQDGQILISASADKTVIFWIIEDNRYSLKILPHPSYVYSAKILPIISKHNFIVTGGRDVYIRVWMLPNKSTSFKLHKEVKGTDDGYTTSIICSKDGKQIYSSDSIGCITEFEIKWKHKIFDIFLLRKFTINNGMINCMRLHPRGKKIFLQFHNKNEIKILDIDSGIVLKYFSDFILNENSQKSNFLFSTCGTIIFTTTIDENINCWNIFNGKLEEKIQNPFKIRNCNFISSIDFHPIDSLFSVTVYGINGGIGILGSKRQIIDDDDDQFKRYNLEKKIILVEEFNVRNNLNEIIKKIDKMFLNSTKLEKLENLENSSNNLIEDKIVKESINNDVNCSDSTNDSNKNDGTYPIINNKKNKSISSKSGTYTIKMDNNEDNNNLHSVDETFTVEIMKDNNCNNNESDNDDDTYNITNPLDKSETIIKDKLLEIENDDTSIESLSN